MQKISPSPHQNPEMIGKHLKHKTSDSRHSLARQSSYSSYPDPDHPHTKTPYKRQRKFRYLIYSLFLSLSLCSFIVSPSSYAATKPADAKGKNIVREEKTCGKGQYFNQETKRCRKIPPQKMKTCKAGYFLNVKTNRCNKIAVLKKPSQPNNPTRTHKPHVGSTNPTHPHSVQSQNEAGSSSSITKNPRTPESSNDNQSSKKEQKTCQSGYFLNKVTGRCNKIHLQTPKTCPAGFFINKVTGRCNKNQIENEKKPCRADQYRNPKTGRCHKVAAPTAPKTCPAGKTLNPTTNRCKGEEKPHEIKPCKEGYERNEETHRCRKVHQNTGASNPVEVPKLGDGKEDQKKNFQGTTAVAGSAAVGVGIAIFQFKDEILVIIRKFFFHK